MKNELLTYRIIRRIMFKDLTYAEMGGDIWYYYQHGYISLDIACALIKFAMLNYGLVG